MLKTIGLMGVATIVGAVCGYLLGHGTTRLEQRKNPKGSSVATSASATEPSAVADIEDRFRQETDLANAVRLN